MATTPRSRIALLARLALPAPLAHLAHLAHLAVLAPIAAGAVAAQPPRFEPRGVIEVETVARWSFDSGPDGWRPVHDVDARARDGRLVLQIRGADPYVHGPEIDAAGDLSVVLRARAAAAGGGQVFWTTRSGATWSEAQSVRFALSHDGAWHDAVVALGPIAGLTRLRLDPGSGPGEVLIDWIELRRTTLHPLEIFEVGAGGRSVRVTVQNHAPEPIDATVSGRRVTLAAGAATEVALEHAPQAAFEPFDVSVEARDLPALRRRLWLHHAEHDGDWFERRSGDLELQVARDGTGARIRLRGELVAVVAPIAHREGAVPRWTSHADDGGDPIELQGDGVHVTLQVEGDRVGYRARSETPLEGPVVRPLGALEQGLFAGLEYLGRGERSSSTLDVETDAHLRYAPDPLLVTMPLMACVSDTCSVALVWRDPELQPTFAAPDFVDATDGQRMALRGRSIDAEIVVARGAALEDVVAEFVARRGLPDLPEAPRDAAAQRALCLAALDGPLRGPLRDRDTPTWGHCAEPRWPRQPFADHASTIWRLTGAVPQLDRVVPGGAHLHDDAVYFVTGRAREWLRVRRDEAVLILREQLEDGSFRYDGAFRRGHFEDTASGLCAQRATRLLEHARLTGDADSLAGGLRALRYIERFRTPRGAQTWEVPLHTPDVLASAYLVSAHVLGFELTGEREHLRRARRWAITGIPFVYQWSRHPTMAYATVPVYGATNWRAPVWFGLPVQWCGVVYADALIRLHRHRDAAPADAQRIDWERLARGILIAGQRMQYPDGPLVGCLPDVFELRAQARAGPSINPCALVSLQLALDGELGGERDGELGGERDGELDRERAGTVAGLAVATDGTRRVVAPFAVRIEGDAAIVDGKPGIDYQVLIDGQRVVEVRSSGRDVVRL